MCFFESWLQLLSKVRVHEDRQGFLYRTLVFVGLFFFVSYQIWEGRDSGRGREGGICMICIHIYIYLIEAMQSPRPGSSSYYYHYYRQNSSTIMWSAAAVLVALTGALIAATGRAFVIVPRQATFCPGYSISNVQLGNTGLTADLSLAGPACNSYGSDIPSLKLMVNYDTGMEFFFFLFLPIHLMVLLDEDDDDDGDDMATSD